MMERHYSSEDTEADEAKARTQEPGYQPLQHLLCAKCGHRWIRRSESLPVRCPRCQSLKWLGTSGKAA